ncbi:hypothetical protein AK830_g2869 [Neonectria ditissima]|uniref:Uncharacterized protein n=1 Tax=Neonectria ditissima TaxID=78410 RepID=A0A0P7BQJ8_9HYPO|nr:hypothetical protein AK830_g2869 [Neonectria ditissima]
MDYEDQAAGKATTVGADPVLGSDQHAFRYERQTMGTKPRYYNPYDQTSHARTVSATWESYPGKIAGFPKPQPPVMESRAGRARPRGPARTGNPGPTASKVLRAPRPARVPKPGPQRVPVPGKRVASSSRTAAAGRSKRPMEDHQVIAVEPTLFWSARPDRVPIPYGFVQVDTPHGPPESFVTRAKAVASGRQLDGAESIRKPEPARIAGSSWETWSSSGTPMLSGSLPDGTPPATSLVSSGTPESGPFRAVPARLSVKDMVWSSLRVYIQCEMPAMFID